MRYAQIMSKLVNRPLLLSPLQADVLYSFMATRAGLEPTLQDWSTRPEASRFVGRRTQTEGGMPFRLEGNVAVIDLIGELVNRGAYVGASSGVVSYEGVDAQLRAVASDPRVAAIIIDMESPGGEAVGAMELAATVRKIAAEKPVYTFVNGLAASAGYAIASGSTRIFTQPSGISGSIGVVLLHLDYSKKLETEGIKPTLIHAGAHKVDGNPFEALSKDVKADLQAEVMQFYSLFVETVAAGRKNLSTEAVRKTQARTFIGEEAVKVGIVDAVSSFEDVLSEINRASGRSNLSKGVKSMTEKTGEPGASNPGLTQADVTAAADKAAKSATDRINAIITAEGISASASRMKAATKLAAMSPHLSADEVVKFTIESVPEASGSSVPPISERANNTNIETGNPGPQKASWGDVLKAKGMHKSQAA